MNFVELDSLNNAKAKVNYLLQMKYKNTVQFSNNDETINTTVPEQFSEVLNYINNMRQYLIQMTELVNIAKSSNAQHYFRNIGSYTNFLKIYLTFSNAMVEVNRILNDIINNIGYVKPENMRLFLDEYVQYRASLLNFGNLFFMRNGS